MLRLNKLVLENFGPFKGTQSLEFPSGNGVVVVYGENMRGKTTLLNAIRYALFGTVLTRHAQTLSLTNIENWEEAQEGKHGFKVILSFSYSDTPYELTRECKLRTGVSKPQSDSDYIQSHFLVRNGNALGPGEAETELSRIMPESVSRFFLFDGELLQQYEELLRDETDMGRQIKEAIERILGVPILTQARSNVRRLYEEAQKAESKAAQKNQHTEELGNNHARLLEERTAHEAEIKRLRQDLGATKSKKLSLEEEVKRIERLLALFNEKEKLSRDNEALDRKQAEKAQRLQDVLSQAWRTLLNKQIDDRSEELQGEIDKLRASEATRTFSKYLHDHIASGLKDSSCPTCEAELNDASRQVLLKLSKQMEEQMAAEDQSFQVERLTASLSALKNGRGPDLAAVVQELQSNIEDCVMGKHTNAERLAEINEQTKALDESEHRKIQAEYERAVQEVGVLEQGILREQERLDEKNNSIQKVEQKLDLLGGANLGMDRHRREVVKKLNDLLSEAVNIYRDELRQSVEGDASKLFLNLTTEPEYSGLKIGENYGLTIVHEDGTSIPVRSAGAEHIVALSLMGALQKNAPLRGPIIMDSPFGRLDNRHTTKVVESLPRMAEQVMLLVYESEMDPQLARHHLLGDLKREYQIVRRTARHSTIEVRNE